MEFWRRNDGDEADAPPAPDYTEAPEEGLDLHLVTREVWGGWPLWAKLRFLRRLRTQYAVPTPRPEQYVDDSLTWYLWLLLGGRGSGKSDEASRWSSEDALRLERIRFALVARTFGDVRDTMFEGETGVLAVIPDEALRGGSRDRAYNRSLGELFLANGSKFKGFSSEKPAGLRGPQHHRAWLDESSSWEDADVPLVEKADGTHAPEVDTTMSNLMLGLRLRAPDGSPVRMVCASTPKPNPLTELLVELAEAQGQVRTLTTYSNLANLDEQVADVTIGMYEGTDVAAQELEGKVLSSAKGAAWSDALVAAARAASRPGDDPDVPLYEAKTVVGVDPSVSSKETSDETGLVAVERVIAGDDAWLGVLADRSGKIPVGVFPFACVGLVEELEADELVVEINNGYDFVTQSIVTHVEAAGGEVIRRTRHESTSPRTRRRTVVEYIITLESGHVFVMKPVWQSMDKLTRAKAASVWWHRGRAWHEPGLEKLEKQQTTFDGTGKKSPDRLDALSSACAAFPAMHRRRASGGASPLAPAPAPPEGSPLHPLLAGAPGRDQATAAVFAARI